MEIRRTNNSFYSVMPIEPAPGAGAPDNQRYAQYQQQKKKNAENPAIATTPDAATALATERAGEKGKGLLLDILA